MFVEMGHVSMELAVMEWHSALMAAMNTDVKDNHLAGLDDVCLAPNASSLIGVIELLIAMMVEMKRVVAMSVMVMMHFLIVMV